MKISLAILFFFVALILPGQTNVSPTNAPLKLLPPYGDLPPTFLEKNAAWIVVAGLGFVLLGAFIVWVIFRPKPKIILPPEIQARQTLEELRRQPENGAVLSRVSQVLRNYFIAAFQLPPGELTTTEFNHALSNCEKINSELAIAATEFLHDCDNQKFSATNGGGKIDAANRALNLIEQAEQRRVQLRSLAETQTKTTRV